MALASLALLSLLANVTVQPSHSLGVLIKLAVSTQEQADIRTIAIFGAADDVEPYIRLLETIPRVLTMESDHEVNYAADLGLNNQILFIAVGALNSDAMRHQLNVVFGNRQSYTRGFFIVPRYVLLPQDHLKKHFQWCWQSGFANALVLVETPIGERRRFTGYLYKRFPHLVVKMLDSKPAEFKFPNKVSDLQGCQIATPVFSDPPRVFGVDDMITKNFEFKGYVGAMFHALIKHLNGSVKILHNHQNVEKRTIQYVVDELRQGHLDIAINAYMPFKGLQLSYPLKMQKWCVAVPSSKEIDVFEYFVRPYQGSTWWACVGCLAYLTFLDALSVGLLVRHGRLDFGRAALEMLRLLLFLPIPTVTRNVLATYRAVCCLQAVILGFILSTVYLAALTSLLADTVFQPQLDTLSDVVQHNISLHVPRHEVEALLESSTHPAGFSELLRPRDQFEVTSDLIELRSDYGYCAHEDLLNFALEQQTDLKLSNIHVVRECLTTVPFGFLMRNNFQLESAVNNFILRCADYGLTAAWANQARLDARRRGLLRIRRTQGSSSNNRPLTVEHLQFAWLVLIVGLTLAALCFVAENLQQIAVYVV